MTPNNNSQKVAKIFATMDGIKELINDGQTTYAKALLESCIMMVDELEPS